MARKREVKDPALVEMGKELHALVKATGKRQRDVADEIGVGIRTFAGYLAGGGDLPVSTLLRLAPVVKKTPEQLIAILARASERAPQSVSQSVSQSDRQTDRQTDSPLPTKP